MLVTTQSENSAIAEANSRLAEGAIAAALDILMAAFNEGDARAARQIASLLLEGRWVRRDMRMSRRFYEHAAELGDEAAAGVVRAFTAAGIGGVRDWRCALNMLRKAADFDNAAAEQSVLIEGMAIDEEGQPVEPSASEQLNADPDISIFPGLFSAAECDYLVRTARPALEKSYVIDPATGLAVPNPVRTSSSTAFPFVLENPAIHALNLRLAAASQTDVRAGEPLQVLSYEPGEQYRAHSDAIPNVRPPQQRKFTFIVYLSDAYEGGETSFPHLDLHVRGRLGDGLLFRNTTKDGCPDPRSIHAGQPVIRGVKQVASRWIRGSALVLE